MPFYRIIVDRKFYLISNGFQYFADNCFLKKNKRNFFYFTIFVRFANGYKTFLWVGSKFSDKL